jgi:hypothetical protein
MKYCCESKNDANETRTHCTNSNQPNLPKPFSIISSSVEGNTFSSCSTESAEFVKIGTQFSIVIAIKTKIKILS